MKRSSKFSTRLSQVVSLMILLAAVIAVGVTACKNNVTSNQSGAKGKLQVKLQDSPARFDSVMIDIQKVEIQDADTASGWMTLNDSSMSVNLLDLTNGTTKIIGEKALAPGTYHQIRLLLGTNNYVVINGQQYDLKVPSGQQSGLKINADATIEPNITYTLLLDFDANRSIVQTGAAMNFILKPVIRATNEAVTGAISGTIQPADAKPVIYAISSSDTLSSVMSDTTSGDFKLTGLPNGTYSLSIVPYDTTAYKDTTITNIDLSVGETKQVGTITLTHK